MKTMLLLYHVNIFESSLLLKALWKAVGWEAGDEGGDPSTSVTAFLSAKPSYYHICKTIILSALPSGLKERGLRIEDYEEEEMTIMRKQYISIMRLLSRKIIIMNMTRTRVQGEI